MIMRKKCLALFLCLLVMLFTTNCTKIGKGKNSGEVNSSENQQKNTNVIKPESDTDNNNGKQQKAVGVYKNSKFGFQINLPESWKGKYRIKEYERGITVCHNSGIDREGIFFSISMFGTEAQWEQRIKTEGEWPYKRLGVNGGIVFVESEPSDAQYDPTINSHKKPSEEFNRLCKDIGTILQSFKFLN